MGTNALGIVLTGMGNDGAEGLLAMNEAGARTFSQDEASSLVYGMPYEAYKNGGAEFQFSLKNIPKEIVHILKEMTENRKFTRIEIKTSTLVTSNGVETQVEIVNLSLGGACIQSKTPLKITTGNQLILSFIFTGEVNGILNIEAKLLNQVKEQYHIRFDTMELESFTHLRNLIEANLEDDIEIEKELQYIRRYKTNT